MLTEQQRAHTHNRTRQVVRIRMLQSTCVTRALAPPLAFKPHKLKACGRKTKRRDPVKASTACGMGAVVMDGSDKTYEKHAELQKEYVKDEAAPAGQEPAGGSCSCTGRIRRLIPPEYWEELGQLLKLAGPVVRLGASPLPSCAYMVTQLNFKPLMMYL